MSITDNIKQQAKRTHTAIQTHDSIQLNGIINKMFYLPRNVQKETEFIKHVMTRGQEQTERWGLHASSLITSEAQFCIRSCVLSLIYKQLQGSEININLMRIFEEGNACHEKYQRMFIRAGYSQPTDLDRTCYNKKYMIQFSPDIICNIPQIHDSPIVGEIKTQNSHIYAKQTVHDSGMKQAKLYMHLTGLTKAFVLVESKNDQEFKTYLYDYDIRDVMVYIQRAEAIMKAYHLLMDKGKLINRKNDCTEYTCKRAQGCAMKDVCYNRSKEKIPDSWYQSIQKDTF